MPRYAFVYHGGKMAATPQEREESMAAWGRWFAENGPSFVDGGGPFGKSTTVSASGVVHDGGPNPASGYSFVEAPDLDAAIAIAAKSPILPEGSVEICQIMPM